MSNSSNYRSGKEIFEEQVSLGEKKGLQHYVFQSIIYGCLAGAFLALGAFAALVASHQVQSYGIAKLINAAIFPVGLILIVICGGELFTSNTLLIQARLEQKITTRVYIVNLAIIWFSNFIGAISIAALIMGSGVLFYNNNSIGGYILHVASNRIQLNLLQAVCSGILCNILVCCAAWGASAAKEVAGKILIIWFAIMAFVIGGFEHCVANMFYFSLALIAKTHPDFILTSGLSQTQINAIDVTNILHNLIPVTIGNTIGGAIFIGVAYWIIYCHGLKSK